MKNITMALPALGIAAVSAWQIQAQQAPPQSPASVCLSRLQQSALALSMYARDNDEHFPAADAWNDALAPLIERKPSTDTAQIMAFSCPLADEGWGYSMNWKLSRRALSEVDSPLATVSIYETNVPRANAAYDGRDLIFRHATTNAAGKTESGGNFAFADGHAGWLPATQKPNFRIFLDNKPRKPAS